MKKKEALDYIREKKGYVPYIQIFDIYGEDDDIPQELIDLECKEDPNTAHNFIICSGKLADELNKINKDHENKIKR